jgi:hypothetical protein
MLQSTLLLLEIILLAATAYVYWMTRKLVTNSNDHPAPHHRHQETLEGQADMAKMAQDVTNLMAELQSVASTARNDLIHQSTNLQDTLGRAEKTITELRTLLDQLETSAPVPEQNTGGEYTPPGPVKNGKMSLTWGEALGNFNEHLHTSDRSKNTVKRILSHVRGFVTWVGGQHYQQVPLSRVDAADVEAYLNHMRNQKYHPNTVKRKLAALRIFTDWANTRLNPESDISINPPPNSNHPSSIKESGFTERDPLPSQGDTNRYQAAFALAEQGLELPKIAARTGLEQETIRTLLTVGPSA